MNFFYRLKFFFNNPPPVSIEVLQTNPYSVKFCRKLLDGCAFKMYGHWVKKADNQNRAALFEHVPREEWQSEFPSWWIMEIGLFTDSFKKNKSRSSRCTASEKIVILLKLVVVKTFERNLFALIGPSLLVQETFYYTACYWIKKVFFFKYLQWIIPYLLRTSFFMSQKTEQYCASNIVFRLSF